MPDVAAVWLQSCATTPLPADRCGALMLARLTRLRSLQMPMHKLPATGEARLGCARPSLRGRASGAASVKVSPASNPCFADGRHVSARAQLFRFETILHASVLETL